MDEERALKNYKNNINKPILGMIKKTVEVNLNSTRQPIIA